MKVYELTITPEVATKIWNTSKGNPRFVSDTKMVNPRKVEELCRVMRNGEWENDGSPIRFAVDGSLIDGHHRIAAVMKSGVTISSIVVEGIPESAEKTIDSNTPRAEYARLKVDRFVPAMIRLEKAMQGGGKPSLMDYVTPTYIDNQIKENLQYIQIISRLRGSESTGRKRYMQNSSFDCALLQALKCGVPESECERIAYKISSGNIDFQTESPLFKLREYCISSHGNNRKCNGARRIKDCCYIQQYIYDYINKINRGISYRKPKPMFTLSLVKN